MKRLREQKKRLKQEDKQRRKAEREQSKTDGTFLEGATDMMDDMADPGDDAQPTEGDSRS